jgi:hypothetical protein
MTCERFERKDRLPRRPYPPRRPQQQQNNNANTNPAAGITHWFVTVGRAAIIAAYESIQAERAQTVSTSTGTSAAAVATGTSGTVANGTSGSGSVANGTSGSGSVANGTSRARATRRRVVPAEEFRVSGIIEL